MKNLMEKDLEINNFLEKRNIPDEIIKRSMPKKDQDTNKLISRSMIGNDILHKEALEIKEKIRL